MGETKTKEVREVINSLENITRYYREVYNPKEEKCKVNSERLHISMS